jgi:uncharacterized protein YbjT (DUF2867 family)
LKIVITSGTGFLGGYLVWQAAESLRRAEKRSAFRQRSVHTAEGAYRLFRPTCAEVSS